MIIPFSGKSKSRKSNNKINRLHERALRIVYNDYDLSFLELLEKDNSYAIHTKNLQTLCVEIFEWRNKISYETSSEAFIIKNLPFNFRRKTIFESRNVRTEHYGIESLTNLGPKIWSQVPDDIKHSGSLEIFKKKS